MMGWGHANVDTSYDLPYFLFFFSHFSAFEVNRIKNGRIVVVDLAQKVIENILSNTQNKAENLNNHWYHNSEAV
jgi:hypothetical protein